MGDKFYITTTLPYVNGVPHIGHAIEFVQADVITRYKRSKLGKEKVFFNLGTDEHGLKIFTKAQTEGKDVKEYVKEYAEKWKIFCSEIYISYDNFYRTGDTGHITVAQTFWKRCMDNGDIYKKKYEGLYCVGCEEFKTRKDLVDGKCPEHGIEPIKHSEENYFFKISRYTEHLLKFIKNNPRFVKPSIKLTELKNFIKNNGEGLQDISISRLRKNLPWGINVPGDSEQVMYVWFDALSNYVGSVGFPENEKKLNDWWPGIQLCGPDNLRFQGAIWQGMLASAGISQTKKLLVHGTVLAEDGTKMSKTKGNVISPSGLMLKYGPEAVRYYLVAGIPTYADASFIEDDLKNGFNADLANNYGNLLNRVIHLGNSRDIDINSEEYISSRYKDLVDSKISIFENLMDNYELYEAYSVIRELTSYGNLYITQEEPWNKEIKEKMVFEVLQNLSYLLKKITEAYSYLLPVSAEKAAKALKGQEKIILFEKIGN